MEIVLVFLVGIITSFLSNISGGGGSLIVLPTLLALGVPSLQAIGTTKLGAMGLVVGSGISSRKQKVVRKDHLIPLLVVAILASLIMPRVALLFNNEQVKLISSSLIVLAAITSLLTWKVAGRSRQLPWWLHQLGYGAYFITFGLQAGFGSGVGILNTYVLIGLVGMSAVEAVSTRRIVGIITLPLQLLVFGFAGEINIPLGLALLGGTAIGGFIGLRVAIHKGSEFVKRAMAVVSIALVGSLFI